MHRIDHSTAALSMPTPDPSGTAGYFTEGDPGGSVPATIVTADWANAVQEELMAVIEEAGLTGDKTSQAQLLAAIVALGGNARAVRSHTGNATLADADIGKVHVAGSAASHTLTLPLAANVAAGKALHFLGSTGATLVVTCSGSDHIRNQLSSTSSPSRSLPGGSTLTLVSNGVDRWLPIGGSSQLAYDRDTFGSRSLSSNGYQKFPGGLFIQWGSGTFTGAAGEVVNVTLPITFPGGCVVATANNGSSTGAGGTAKPPSVGATIVSASQINVQQHTDVAFSTIYHWYAIGY